VARAALVAVGAVLVAAGGALAGYGATRPKTGGMTPESSAVMSSAIRDLDGVIKAARATVKERASTIAALQAVQGAVVTNETTTRDMLSRGELNFQPQNGEVVELGQIVKDMQPTPLLIQPDGGMHSAHAGKPGGYVDLVGDQVVITDVAAVVPKDKANELSGYIAVSRPLDLAPALAGLTKAGVAGTFEIAGKTKQIGTPAAGATLQPMPLSSQDGAQLVVAVPPMTGGMQVPLVAGGGGAGVVGLLLLIAGLVTGKRAAGAPSVQQQLTPAQFAAAQTQISQANAVASGTPAPLDTAGVSIAPANLGAGAMIGRWEIIKRLGSGGMADVYLARARGEAGFEKQVAVKVMHPHLARNERAVEHFLDEAKLAARISHPNVVQIQDLGKIGNDYVIVMEYVDGVDLERLLSSARAAQRQVPVDVGLGILCRICDGLNAAHRSTTTDGRPMNLVHRDVKSANVLVSKQGGVKVVDFGIAKALGQNHLTVAGETKGTPSMMAPEQRVGETVDVRADVYSVGAVAYEILTGHGVNLDLAALAHLGVENWPHLPLPSSLRPQLPDELDALLMSAMAFDRERRPADCAVFEAQVEAIMKRRGFAVSDKDIARWVTSEIGMLVPAPSEPPRDTKPAGSQR
jgi:serine/threonine-protein kinase